MPFKLIEYDKLKQSVKESIKTLIEKHDKEHKGEIDITKLGDFLPLIQSNNERKAQAGFLLKVIELTDAIADNDKKKLILNAAAYYIYNAIDSSYTAMTLSNSDNSSLCHSLKISLDLNTNENEKKPQNNDKFVLFTALNQFLREHAFQPGKELKYREGHPFEAIEGFKGYLNDLLEKIYQLESSRLATVNKAQEEAHKPKAAASSSLLSWLPRASKKTLEEPVKTIEAAPAP